MKPDPVIKRIRDVRYQISEECNHDPKKLINYFKKCELNYKDRIVKEISITK